MLKDCDVCGKEYCYYHPSSKYCSKKCYYRKYRKNNKRKINLCAAKYRKRKKLENPNWKNCLNCNKRFIVDKGFVKYCSNECRKERRIRKVTERELKWRNENLEKSKENQRNYYHKNKKIINEKRKNNPKMREYRKKYMNLYIKKRYKTDKLFNIAFRLRQNLRNSLNRYSKTGKVIKSKQYGINYKKIIEYLKPFPEDLSKYDVDHILPLCKFDLDNKLHIKIAFHPFNHQWMLSGKNGGKKDKIDFKKYPEQKGLFYKICNDLGIKRNP